MLLDKIELVMALVFVMRSQQGQVLRMFRDFSKDCVKIRDILGITLKNEIWRNT